MRFTGTLKSWNDDRGFGFIEPEQGGQDVFVHIRSFKGLRERPQPGWRVSFQVETGPDGKKRAVSADIVRPQRDSAAHTMTTPRSAKRMAGGQQRVTALWPIAAFGLMLFVGQVWGAPPPWAPWAYLGMSLLTFLTYALDKSAAQRGAWRTSESTLHALALLGGWPGALIAQRLLRHKSAKQPFRAVFWATVVANVLAFAWLASPQGQRLPNWLTALPAA